MPRNMHTSDPLQHLDQNSAIDVVCLDVVTFTDGNSRKTIKALDKTDQVGNGEIQYRKIAVGLRQYTTYRAMSIPYEVGCDFLLALP